MKTYLIELTLPIHNRNIKMVCKADEERDAYYLSQALADIMPQESAYFDKDNRVTTVHWQGTAEELPDN